MFVLPTRAVYSYTVMFVLPMRAVYSYTVMFVLPTRAVYSYTVMFVLPIGNSLKHFTKVQSFLISKMDLVSQFDRMGCIKCVLSRVECNERWTAVDDDVDQCMRQGVNRTIDVVLTGKIKVKRGNRIVR